MTMVSHALSFPQHADLPHPPQLLPRAVPPLQVLKLPQLGHFHPLLPLQLLQHVAVGLEALPLVDPLHRLLPPDVEGHLAFVLEVLAFRLALHLPEKIFVTKVGHKIGGYESCQSTVTGDSQQVTTRNMKCQQRDSLMFCKHLASGIAHDAPSNGGEHAQLQAGKKDHRPPNKGGNYQATSDRDLKNKFCGRRP